LERDGQVLERSPDRRGRRGAHGSAELLDLAVELGPEVGRARAVAPGPHFVGEHQLVEPPGAVMTITREDALTVADVASLLELKPYTVEE
jgi:hypothetical protein